MYDRPALWIISFFLLISAFGLLRYLLRLGGGAHSLSGASFLLLSTLVGGFGLCFTALLGPEQVVLSFALSLGITLSLLHPIAAICFFVSALFLRPWEAMPGNALLSLLPRLLAGLTLVSWVLFCVRTSRERVVWNVPIQMFCILLAWLLICAAFSPTPSASFDFYFENFVPIGALTFMLVNSISRAEDVRVLLRTLITAILGVVAVGIHTTIKATELSPQYGRLHGIGLWGNANDLAALIVIAIPLTLGTLAGERVPRLRRLAVYGLACIFGAALLWSQSRGALLSVAAAGLAYVIFCTKSKGKALLVAFSILALPPLYVISSQREERDLEGSQASRANYLIAGLRMAKSHPIFGVGLNNYSEVYERYTPAFVEWGKRTAHSSWVLVLSEAGVPGLIFFTGLYLLVARAAWRLRKIAPQLLIALIGYGVAMSFLSHTYLFLPYVLMGIIIGAAHFYRYAPAPAKRVERAPLTATSVPRRAALAAACGLAVLLPDAIGHCQVIVLEAAAGADKSVASFRPRTMPELVLKGSRGETLLYLLRLRGAGCHSLSVTLGDGLESRLYTLPTIHTASASFPGAHVGAHYDPVVPLSTKVCLESTRDTWLLGEVAISRDAEPGPRRGGITSGNKSIPLQLVVWRMTIPEEPAIPAYSELTPWFVVLGHHGKWHEDEGRLAKRYIEAMAEHRVYPLKAHVARLEFVERAGGEVLEIDKKPSAEASFRALSLSRPSWAYFDFSTVGASGFEEIDFGFAARYFSAVERTISQIGRPGRALVYLWDEPKADRMPELVRLSRFVRKYAPSLRQLVTVTYQPELRQTVDIFCPVMENFDVEGYPPVETYQKLQNEGKEVWLYISCMSHGCDALADSGTPDMTIERPSVYVRSIGWILARYGIDAFLYYSVVNGYQFFPKRDPWQSLWDFSGNGDGTLFYPGRPGERGFADHLPVASIRLKLWRESSFDAEYVKWMEQRPIRPAWWDSEYSALARSTTRWSRRYTDFQSLRDRAGEYLDKGGA